MALSRVEARVDRAQQDRARVELMPVSLQVTGEAADVRVLHGELHLRAGDTQVSGEFAGDLLRPMLPAVLAPASRRLPEVEVPADRISQPRVLGGSLVLRARVLPPCRVTHLEGFARRHAPQCSCAPRGRGHRPGAQGSPPRQTRPPPLPVTAGSLARGDAEVMSRAETPRTAERADGAGCCLAAKLAANWTAHCAFQRTAAIDSQRPDLQLCTSMDVCGHRLARLKSVGSAVRSRP